MPPGIILNIDKEILIQKYLYERLNLNKLAKYFNTNRNTIARYIKIYNIPKRNNSIYSFDEYFFDIPNVFNAYWSGFIAADGCIANKKTKQGSNYLSIGLSVEDMDQLYNFKNDIRFDGPITIDKKNICKLRIFSQKICDDLYKHFNITPRKTLTLEPPKNLTDDEIIAFIVGYIDGDGSISYIKGMPNINMIGTLNMMNWFKDSLIRILQMEWKLGISKSTYKKTGNTVYRLQIYSISDILKIYNKTRKLELKVMERKWSKIQHALEENKPRVAKALKRKQRIITYNGISLTIKEWSSIIKIDINTLNRRYSLGWSHDKIITTPIRYKNDNGDNQ